MAETATQLRQRILDTLDKQGQKYVETYQTAAEAISTATVNLLSKRIDKTDAEIENIKQTFSDAFSQRESFGMFLLDLGISLIPSVFVGHLVESVVKSRMPSIVVHRKTAVTTTRALMQKNMLGREKTDILTNSQALQTILIDLDEIFTQVVSEIDIDNSKLTETLSFEFLSPIINDAIQKIGGDLYTYTNGSAELKMFNPANNTETTAQKFKNYFAKISGYEPAAYIKAATEKIRDQQKLINEKSAIINARYYNAIEDIGTLQAAAEKYEQINDNYESTREIADDLGSVLTDLFEGILWILYLGPPVKWITTTQSPDVSFKVNIHQVYHDYLVERFMVLPEVAGRDNIISYKKYYDQLKKKALGRYSGDGIDKIVQPKWSYDVPVGTPIYQLDHKVISDPSSLNYTSAQMAFYFLQGFFMKIDREITKSDGDLKALVDKYAF